MICVFTHISERLCLSRLLLGDDSGLFSLCSVPLSVRIGWDTGKIGETVSTFYFVNPVGAPIHHLYPVRQAYFFAYPASVTFIVGIKGSSHVRQTNISKKTGEKRKYKIGHGDP